MADYALMGKKGSGKSKNAIRLIRDRYLLRKRLVATNLDVFLEPMFGPQSRMTYVRVPDKPSAFDLLSIGHGNPGSYDEDLNGGLFLDEMGTWLNSRTFGDKGRAETLDYFAHARKHGFDTYYIMQNVVQVDKQLRESFIEQTVRHTRFDKVRIPFIGGFLAALFGDRAGYLPKFHVATARMGTGPMEMVSDRASYLGKDLEPCYDTRQVFLVNYPHGTHSVLSPWHVTGRFLPPAPLPWWKSFFSKTPVVSIVKPRPPLTVPDPAFARVLALCKQLPPAERIRILSRWDRLRQPCACPASAGLAPGRRGRVHVSP